MTRRLTRKEMKTDEFVESAVDATQWLEENWAMVARWAVAAVVAGGIALGIYVYLGYSRGQAELALADGIQRYQAAETGGFEAPEEVEAALARFDDAAGRMGAGAAGRSATFYRGAALYRLGRVEEALGVLEPLSRDELTATLAAGTESLLAEVLAANGQPDRAIEVLERLSLATDSAYPPDMALLQIGKIHAREGRADQAKTVWQRVLDEHPQSAGAAEASRLLSAP